MHTFCSLFSHLFYKKTKSTLPPPTLFTCLYILEFHSITQRLFSFSGCSCTELHCVAAAPCSCTVGLDHDQFSLSSVCGHGGSGYICCLTTLCQALGVKTKPALASGSSAQEVYSKEHSLSPRARLDPLSTGAHVTRKKRTAQSGRNNLLLTSIMLHLDLCMGRFPWMWLTVIDQECHQLVRGGKAKWKRPRVRIRMTTFPWQEEM